MKRFLLLCLVSLSSVSMAVCQSTVWTDPIPVTDSLSNNVNFNMPGLFDSYGDSIYFAWERSVDASSTAIYVRNLMTMSEPIPILSQPNVHFRHPIVFNWMSGDTILLVLYETNINGNWDIYFSKVLNDGSVAPPVAVCNSPVDELNYKYRFSLGIVWEQNGAIMIKKYSIGGNPSLEPPVTLDQGNCHHPQLSSAYCEWEKVIGTDTVIMYSVYQYTSSTWTAPSQLIDGINKNLSSGSGGGENSSLILWQAKEGSNWSLRCADLYDEMFYSVNDFQGANNIYPTFTDVLVITKTGFPFFAAFLSFSSDITGNYEIYVNQNFWDTVYFNLSNYPSVNTHPQFFSSFSYMYGYQTIFICWESWRNNHWQVWMSHLDIAMGIDGRNAPGLTVLENYPNPFNGSTTITYELTSTSTSSIVIYNIMGKKLISLKDGTEQQGKHSVVWDGKDENGYHLPPGIYLCSLKINGHLVQRKLTIL